MKNRLSSTILPFWCLLAARRQRPKMPRTFLQSRCSPVNREQKTIWTLSSHPRSSLIRASCGLGTFRQYLPQRLMSFFWKSYWTKDSIMAKPGTVVSVPSEKLCFSNASTSWSDKSPSTVQSEDFYLSKFVMNSVSNSMHSKDCMIAPSPTVCDMPW